MLRSESITFHVLPVNYYTSWHFQERNFCIAWLDHYCSLQTEPHHTKIWIKSSVLRLKELWPGCRPTLLLVWQGRENRGLRGSGIVVDFGTLHSANETIKWMRIITIKRVVWGKQGWMDRFISAFILKLDINRLCINNDPGPLELQ